MTKLECVFKDLLDEATEGMTKSETLYFIENDAIPDAGSIPGLMYTDDIMKIYSENYNDIKDIVGETTECDPTKMVIAAWFALLNDIGDDVLDERVEVVTVPKEIYRFFEKEEGGVVLDIADYVTVEDDELVLDPEIANYDDDLRTEMRAYVWYNKDIKSIYSICTEIDNFVSDLSSIYLYEDKIILKEGK
jgi:hypothetical protein